MTIATRQPDEEHLKIAASNKPKLDRVLDRVSEIFSSILVKETRQALKSRQFLWTFFGLLLVVTLWVFGGLAYLTSEWGESDSPGQYLLFGFWLILGFPLVIVIPFAAFRSLLSEFEDGTIQLVSITTLRPYQIIWGKLGSAMLQILLYISVLAPCIAFTYLLRGIDLRQIWIGLMICVVTSIGFSVLGLFLASATRNRQFGVAISVLMLFGLAFSYWMWGLFSYGMTYEMANMFAGMEQEQSNTMLFGYFSLVASTTFVLFTAAAALVSFDADNRSTWIRIAMLIQQVLFFGWTVALLTFAPPADAGGIMSMVIIHYWLFMGAMMSSVPAIMSRRVKRTLPQSILGRSTISLFMPGPGRGYLFAVANMLGWNALLVILVFFAEVLLPDIGSPNTGSSRTLTRTEAMEFLGVVGTNLIYGITYLSILFLMLHQSIKKRPNAGPLLGGVMTVVFLMAASFIPILLVLQFVDRNYDYSALLFTNWYATFSEVARYGVSEESVASCGIMLVIMLLTGYFSVRISGRELHYLPEAIPNRVLEEDKAKRLARMAPVGETIEDIFSEPRE